MAVCRHLWVLDPTPEREKEVSLQTSECRTTVGLLLIPSEAQCKTGIVQGGTEAQLTASDFPVDLKICIEAVQWCLELFV